MDWPGYLRPCPRKSLTRLLEWIPAADWFPEFDVVLVRLFSPAPAFPFFAKFMPTLFLARRKFMSEALFLVAIKWLLEKNIL